MTVSTKPAPSHVRPILSLFALSDSFSALWPRLAAECGLALELFGREDAVPRSDGSRVVLLSVGGAESQMEDALSRLAAAGLAPAVVGGLPDHHLAQRVLRGGAAEYFALPADLPLLKAWLTRQAEQIQARATSERFASREASKFQFEGILGQSPALRETLERAARVIPHGVVTVLINGETGTGKELLARAIHYNGPRRAAPFVDVNCAAIPEHLLESELFGHEKGAFTDASATKPGLFEVASGGTIFLDEIGHLSLSLQGKLLRVLEQREMRRVGGTSSIEVKVRVIAATHVDLAEASRRGEFREDLYYRLNVVGLRLPPLRERAGDVLLLTRALLARFAREYGLTEPRLTPAAERRLLSHSWPGNVRELRNVLERAILLGRPGAPLDEADLGLEGAARAVVGGNGAVPFPASMSEIIRAAASGMVQLCEGNKSEAARRLRISRTRLLRLLAPRGRRASTSEEDF
jgi:two-component system response regulator HydG